MSKNLQKPFPPEAGYNLTSLTCNNNLIPADPGSRSDCLAKKAPRPPLHGNHLSGMPRMDELLT
jgi:hypothetical protein